MFDADAWLAPIDANNPSGDSLRNSDVFVQLVAKASAKFEVIRNDSNLIVDETTAPVAWGDILDDAVELSASGRDIRLLTLVTRALFGRDGLAGLAQGLTLIASAIDQYWDSIHPQLRESDKLWDAAIRRRNALGDLENEGAGLLGELRRSEIIKIKGIPAIKGRDLWLSKMSNDQMLRTTCKGLDTALEAEAIQIHEALCNRVAGAGRAIKDQAPEALETLAKDAEASVVAIEKIETVMSKRLGDTYRFKELGALLRGVRDALVAAHQEAEASLVETDKNDDGSSVADQSGTSQTQPSGAAMGAIKSRKDVEQCLQLIIDFYERTEPSNPLPMLARRMKRMVRMDFLELMAELAPGGLKEFRSVAGLEDKK